MENNMSANKNKLKPDEFSVADLFGSGQYIIPIYQRNYAWGKEEVEQLLQDLMDVAQTNKGDYYYLGSLVVHQCEDGKFEIIDGQQRHTTLCILMAVLKNELRINNEQRINLEFRHRSISDKTLAVLFDKGLKGNVNDEMEPAILAAYKIVKTFLENSQNLKVAYSGST